MKGIVVGDVVYADAVTRLYLRGHEGLSPSLKAIGRDGLVPPVLVDDGEMKNEERVHLGLQLTLEEALWLMKQTDLHIMKIGSSYGDGEIAMEQFHEYCTTRRETFNADYTVFTHFTDKGYLVKPGILYGVDYTVYEGSPTKYHSKFVVLVLKDNKCIEWSHLQCIMRIMTNVKKSLLICEIDKSGKVCEVLVRAVLANQPHPVDVDTRRRRRTKVHDAKVNEEQEEISTTRDDEEVFHNSNNASQVVVLLDEDHDHTAPPATETTIPYRRRRKSSLCHCVIT